MLEATIDAKKEELGKQEKLDAMLQEYYDGVVVVARTKPEEYDDKHRELAHKDPRGLAKRFTKDLRKYLLSLQPDDFERAYADYLTDLRLTMDLD